MFSSKGGTGATVVAVNLVVLLAARAAGAVALVDLTGPPSDAAGMLRLEGAEVAPGATPDDILGRTVAHPCGVHVLADLRPGPALDTRPEDVMRALGELRRRYHSVVVDGPAAFTDPLLAALDASDACILVTSMDVPSIKNLRVALSVFARLGLERDRLHVVLNRADSRVGLTVRHVEQTLQTSIDVTIPSSREVPLSVNVGLPVGAGATSSGVARAMAGLAERVRRSLTVDVEPPPPAHPTDGVPDQWSGPARAPVSTNAPATGRRPWPARRVLDRTSGPWQPFRGTSWHQEPSGRRASGS